MIGVSECNNERPNFTCDKLQEFSWVLSQLHSYTYIIIGILRDVSGPVGTRVVYIYAFESTYRRESKRTIISHDPVHVLYL